MLQWEYIDEKHRSLIENFRCEDEPTVSKFLRDEALDCHIMNTAKTRLYFDSEGNLVGYFTLYNDMMMIGRNKRRRHGLSNLPSYQYFPAIKLHYLGVDSNYRNSGYGRSLLVSIFKLSKEISCISGCLFLTVESLRSSTGFYYKHEFHKLGINGDFINMFFKISEI